MNGLTLYVCFGRYGGFGVKRDGPSVRLTLGWVSFAAVARDIEVYIGLANDIHNGRTPLSERADAFVPGSDT